MEGDLSDGELCEDLSDISSDLDFFESLKKKLESSKHQHQEKENHYKYKRQDSRKRKSKPGSSRRNVCHKRRRKSRHHLSVRKKTASPLREDFGEPESSDEEELLKLRLHALKSTLETDSELKSKKTTSTNLPPDDDIAIIDDHTQGICEEDSLRIQALRSAVIKRKEFLRKKRQMIRSEDYSPTSFTPLDDDDDIESQLCDIEHNEILSSGSPVDMTKTANDEELELRTLLIQSIRKKDVPRLPSPTPNLVASKQQVLKQAVLRLQQKTLTETMVPCKNELSSLEVESTKQELLGDKLQNDQPCPENSNPPESLAVQPTSECSRLITSFESVTKPVERMVICLESDSDEMHSPKPKKSEAFEKNLDSFLKTIRFRHESSHSKKVVKQNTVKSKDNVSVSGLSKASQIEYQELIRKIKILEEAKQSRLKAKELKRTKVVSEKPVADPSAANYAPGKSQDKADAIQESLKKISTLDRSAQKRLIEKAEKITTITNPIYIPSVHRIWNCFDPTTSFFEAKSTLKTKFLRLKNC